MKTIRERFQRMDQEGRFILFLFGGVGLLCLALPLVAALAARLGQCH